MNRVKRLKKKKVTLSESDIAKLKREVTKDAANKAWLVLLAAVVDELSIDDNQLCSILERTDRYAGYIDEHIAKMEDIRRTIEKGTGIVMKGWK